jgi:ABC-type transport system involved in multi-copper enzyme maturation permease subunit
MSTIVAPITTNTATMRRPDTDAPLLGDVIRSEWVKLRSLRSTYWTFLATAGMMVSLGTLLCASYISRYDRLIPAERATFNPVGFSLNGIFLAQLAIGVLGVLVITSEFGTGMIRATLATVPQRRVVLAAKALVFALAATVVGVASSIITFVLGQAILSTKGLGVPLTHPGAWRAVVGAGLYLTILGLMSLAVGTIIRRTAGSIATVFGVVFVLPILVAQLPSSWGDPIAKYLPSAAGLAIVGNERGVSALSPWAGFAVFCGYAAVGLGIAAVAFSRRDA